VRSCCTSLEYPPSHCQRAEEIEHVLRVGQEHEKKISDLEKTISDLTDDLRAYKEAWSSSERTKRAMQDRSITEQLTWDKERQALETQIAALKVGP
jgi:hypothetical protein